MMAWQKQASKLVRPAGMEQPAAIARYTVKELLQLRLAPQAVIGQERELVSQPVPELVSLLVPYLVQNAASQPVSAAQLPEELERLYLDDLR
jgi:hypothetical protein